MPTGPSDKAVRHFGKHLGTAHGDLAICYYMTEAIFPTVLH
jgi:hypothetical protein